MRLWWLVLLATQLEGSTISGYNSLWELPFSVNRTDLIDILTFSLKGRTCSQVYIADYDVAIKLLEIIHNNPSSPSLYNKIEINQLFNCPFRIYICSTVESVIRALMDKPIDRTDFLILFYDVDKKEYYHLVQTASRYIGVGKGVMVNFYDTNIIYKYSPIHRRFFNGSIDKIFTNQQVEKGQKYESFRGKLLRVGTFNCTVNSQIGPLDYRGKPKWLRGVEMKLVHELSRKLNFNYRVVVPRGKNKIGTVTEDGKFSGGLMEMLSRKEVDMAFCGLWLTGYQRASILTYTAPVTSICLTFLIPRPAPFSQSGLGLFSSFQWQVWATAAGETIFIALFVKGLTYLCARMLKANKSLSQSRMLKEWKLKGLEKFQKSTLVLWAILFGNAPKSEPHLGPLRHVLSWWAFSAMVLNALFASSLISHLTKVLYNEPIHTFRELIEEDFQWSTESFPNFGSVFNLENKWENKWVERHTRERGKEICKNLKRGDNRYAIFALNYQSGVLLNMNFSGCENHLKYYEVMNLCFNKVFTALVLQDKSPYTDIFSDYITRYREAGVFVKEYEEELHLLALKQSYVKETTVPTSKTHKLRMNLKLSNFLATFYLFTLGIGISMIVFLIELLWYYRKKMCKKCYMQEAKTE